MDTNKLSLIRRFINCLKVLNMARVFNTETVHTDESYMHIFSEIFSLGAFYISDKISILLNVMNSGLYYHGTKDLSQDQCCQLISLLGLAAGDPTSLTANGRRIESVGLSTVKSLQCARLPGAGYQARPVGLLGIPHTSIDAVVVEAGLEIGMIFMQSTDILLAPQQHFLSLARLLIDHKALAQSPLTDPLMRLNYEEEEERYAEI
jgi:hypothetical protein